MSTKPQVVSSSRELAKKQIQNVQTRLKKPNTNQTTRSNLQPESANTTLNSTFNHSFAKELLLNGKKNNQLASNQSSLQSTPVHKITQVEKRKANFIPSSTVHQSASNKLKQSQIFNVSLNQSAMFKSSAILQNNSILAKQQKPQKDLFLNFLSKKMPIKQPTSDINKIIKNNLTSKNKLDLSLIPQSAKNVDNFSAKANSTRLSQRAQPIPQTPKTPHAKEISQAKEPQQVQQETQGMTPAQAIKQFLPKLTDLEQSEILNFPQIYFVGPQAKKVEVQVSDGINNGYDDERGDYIIVEKDHISYRFEILGVLGKGSFGQVVKCFDHKTQQFIALKIIRNKRRFHQQAAIEVKILEYMKKKDPNNQNFCIQLKE